MEQFIWQNKSWPHFFWNPQSIIYPLADLYKKQGLLEGLLKSTDQNTVKTIAVNCFSTEIINSYKLDNIELNESALKNIIAKKMGIESIITKIPQLPHIESLRLETIVSVFFEILKNAENSLTLQNLITWNKRLASTIDTDAADISLGDEEKGSLENNFRMEEYSYIKDDTVHYTAPPQKSLPSEMELFLNWFNNCNSFQDLDNILKSAISQFYLIALRPFDKANNILARMISYGALYNKNSSQSKYVVSYFYSLTEQTVNNQKDYIYMLIQMAKGNLDMTIWLSWCIKNSIKAITSVINNIDNDFVLQHKHSLQSDKKQHVKQTSVKPVTAKKEETKSETKTEPKTEPKKSVSQQKKENKEKPLLNKRQQAALDYMKSGADSKFSTSEYSKLFKCSQDTASRDLAKLLSLDLIEKGDGKGKNTYYSIKS